jgi:hypothetical protein
LLCSAPALARESQLPLDSRLQPVDRPDRWGIGFTLGEPFGLTLKRYLGRNAFDLYAAFAYGPGIRFGGDWLWNLGRIERGPKFDLDIYAGVGPYIGEFTSPCGPGFINNSCNGDVYLGGRVPLGVELLLKEAPLTFGIEIAPGIAFAPSRAGLTLDFDLAVRLLL